MRSSVGGRVRGPGCPVPLTATTTLCLSLLALALVAAPVRASGPPIPLAVDEAPAAGIAESTNTWSAAVGDYNSDGWPDFFLSRHGQAPAQLFINDALGHFTEVDAGTFVINDRHDCHPADVNGDGLLDVFCSTGAEHGYGIKSDELWVQGPGLTFTDQAVSYGVADPFGRGRHSTFIDADHLGGIDLFVGNDSERPDGLPTSNRLLLDANGSTFVDAPSMGVDQEIGAACAESGDYDGDGWEDLLVCPGGTEGMKLYRNDGGTGFTDVSSGVGISGDQGVGDATLADLNGDGLLDLVEVSGTLLRVRIQSAGVFQSAFTMPLSAGLSVAVGDANADGVPDVYVLQGGVGGNLPDLMLLNNGDGTSFTQMSIPETSLGRGDAVYPIDYDRNGYTDFLVLNGHASMNGPIQLIAFFPGSRGHSRVGPWGGAAARPPSPPATSDPAAAPPCGPTWSVVPSPPLGATLNGLSGLAVVGPGDVWGVGHQHPTGGSIQTVAEHWDGAAWTVSSTPPVGQGDNAFNAVATLSSTDAWAVGFSSLSGTGSVYQTLAEHWDGTGWTASGTPNPGDQSDVLTDVAAIAPDDVWAVGYQIGQDLSTTLAMHWDGLTWALAPTPNAGSGNNVLIAVAAAGPDDVWAVGRSSFGSVQQTLIEHWDGSTWTISPSPSPGTGDNVLTGVAAAGHDDVWAVGGANFGSYRTLVLHWDGSTWTEVSSPNGGSSFDVLRSVSAASATDLWATGVTYAAASGHFQTFVEHFDGAEWSVVSSPTASGDQELVGVAAGTGLEVWGAGWSDTTGQVVTQRLCPILVSAAGFSPQAATVKQGGSVAWKIDPAGTGGHTVTESSTRLFDSGTRLPGGSFVYTFFGAGTYGVLDEATGKAGQVRVPALASPRTGGLATVFRVTWAASPAPTGYAFDVQIKRPGSTSFVNWLTGQTLLSSTFVPDTGPGSYSFRAWLRKLDTGKHSNWSPVASITVTS